MKLTKLELSGFKSFADTVTLNFEDGVTAIVGPNGCGKSNVSDAVRWVLGEQSARLLRGGKMEDVIFQGAAGRRPVNVCEVSLYFDNSSGELPTPYTEVVISRRLSRSGQSDYLLNRAPVRLRDIHDLLRGTGLGSDAGVVIEAKLIDLLLSDRADERRSLFEEAAGIGLYRDRRHATARRLEETGGDLQRLEDLIAEVGSQIRSLARQKGKAQRHQQLTEEKFGVTIALAQRQLAKLAEDAVTFERRHAELTEQLPAARERLTTCEGSRETAAQERAVAERHRATVVDDLAEARLELGKLEGDLAVAAERLANAAQRRQRAQTERHDLELRAQQAQLDLETAGEESTVAEGEHARIRLELDGRTEAEQEGRTRVATHREAVRNIEHALQGHAEQQRQLEGERTALDGETSSLHERITQEESHQAKLAADRQSTGEKLTEARAVADRHIEESRRAAATAEQARLRLRETRDREARETAERRTLEEDLATLTARQSALEALERDRVGIAPAAAALLARRDEYGEGVIGTLADVIGVDGDQADLAEQLLGEFVHAVLVRDEATVRRIRAWHEQEHPGTLILLPVEPGPEQHGGEIDSRLQVQPVAHGWVAALVGGSQPLADGGRGVRRRNGSIWLTGPASTTGPLQRRAELNALAGRITDATAAFETADGRRTATREELAQLEVEATESEQHAATLRETERQAIAAREDLARRVGNLDRELQELEGQLARLHDRLTRATARRDEVNQLLENGTTARLELDEQLVAGRARLGELEGEQEVAREARSEWQVQEAHIAARLRSARETAERAARVITESQAGIAARTEELARLDADATELEARRADWQGGRDERASALMALETAAGEAAGTLEGASTRLDEAERQLAQARHLVEELSEEHHGLAVGVTEAKAERRRVVERVETEWKRPFEELVEAAPPVEADLETLTEEAERITSALEAIGIVNPLAMEEWTEESKRLTFLQTQRDDLVAARQTLLQAIREIDGTAKALFLETFTAVRSNFVNVFQTLFGGGECDLRLSDTDDPLEAEIEIHAAPRGKRTQRIHLLSSGERTLVAASLLFSIYLTKPSPFCLMDEVDAPLDDANVGRFLRLLDEFKEQTQFLVITHNPRTMQAADSVYGVTMQEPGVSTIVGVRLGEHDTAA
jgi:chromosome segregation protein